VDDAALAERGRRLRKKPAQLRDRARLRLMLREVLLGQLAQRDPRKPPVTPLQPLERDLQRLQRLALSREPAHLWPRRAATIDAIAIRPGRLAMRPRVFSLNTCPCCAISDSSLSISEGQSRGVGRAPWRRSRALF